MTVTTPFSRRAPSEMINSRLLQRSNRAIGTLDFWLHRSRDGVVGLRDDLKRLQPLVDLCHSSHARTDVDKQTERDKYYTWNPRLLRGVQRSMDPQGLVHVYCRPRNLTRVEDEVLHPVKCVNGIYVASKIHYRLNRPPIPTRDRDGLRILDNLEVLRAKLDAAAPDKKRSLSHEEGETLLFERNWPLTEPNKGKNFQEFIKR